jgi:hypothetical protein
MAKKTEITFEVEETFILKQGGKIVTEFCSGCGADVDFVSPDILRMATGTSEREIFRLIETGAIHFVEAERLVVCPGCYNRLLLEDGKGHADATA